MEKNEYKVGIILPVHNRLSHTKKTLNNITSSIKNANINFLCDFVVLDDGSQDGTKEWINKNYPEIHILFGDGNYYWTKSVTIGAKYALKKLNCSHILLWNNDIITNRDYFVTLGEKLDIMKPNEIFGSIVYFLDDKNKIWSAGGKFNFKTGKRIQLRMGDHDPEKTPKFYEVDWVTGMGTIISKEIFQKIGFWNYNLFPQYHGDSEFTLRAKLHGINVKVYNQLKIWNDTNSTGIKHNNNIELFVKSFYLINSSHNIKDEFNIIKHYANSNIKYLVLLHRYSLYIFGFIKWKILSLFNITRDKN